MSWSKIEPFNIFKLFFLPFRYFASVEPLRSGWFMATNLLFVGFAIVFNLVDNQMNAINSTDAFLQFSQNFDAWHKVWGVALLTAPIVACLYWYLGGAWFGLRAKWCGDSQLNNQLNRRLYLVCKLIMALPTVIAMFIATIWFESFVSISVEAKDVWSLVLIAFILWSFIIEYIAATSVLFVEGFWPIFWFILLPMAVLLTTVWVFSEYLSWLTYLF